MKQLLYLTRCPTCARPFAALRNGASRAWSWLPIDDNVINLAGDALTWCDRCDAPLPIAPAVQAIAVDESAVQP